MAVRNAAADAAVARAAARLRGVSIAYGTSIAITAVIMIVLYVHTALWIISLKRNKGCQCAQGWRKDYVLFFPAASIVTHIAVQSFAGPAFASVFNLILTAGWIVFIVAALQFVKALKDARCTCATAGLGDDALHVYAYMPIVC